MVAGGADALAPRRNGCASYSRADRKAGYRYQISILQAEFSLTQVLDRPTAGRLLLRSFVKTSTSVDQARCSCLRPTREHALAGPFPHQGHHLGCHFLLAR